MSRELPLAGTLEMPAKREARHRRIAACNGKDVALSFSAESVS